MPSLPSSQPRERGLLFFHFPLSKEQMRDRSLHDCFPYNITFLPTYLLTPHGYTALFSRSNICNYWLHFARCPLYKNGQCYLGKRLTLLPEGSSLLNAIVSSSEPLLVTVFTWGFLWLNSYSRKSIAHLQTSSGIINNKNKSSGTYYCMHISYVNFFLLCNEVTIAEIELINVT